MTSLNGTLPGLAASFNWQKIPAVAKWLQKIYEF
jgi:hypothetical protein